MSENPKEQNKASLGHVHRAMEFISENLGALVSPRMGSFSAVFRATFLCFA
jgi:hypothetical protein